MSRIRSRAVLVKAIAASALVTGVCLAMPASAATRSPDGSWSSQLEVPHVTSSLAPAAYASGQTLYVVYTTSKGDIDYVSHTTKWPKKVKTVEGKSVTTTAPAVTFFDGHLYVFWTSKSDQVSYTDLVKGKWQAARIVSGSWGTAESTASPSVTVAEGDLWVVWKGHSTDNIYYSSSTGTTWAKQQVAVDDATGLSPTVAPTGLSAAPLVMAWTTSSNEIDYGILGFLGFETLGTVPVAGTNAAPALEFMPAAPDETMYLAWKGTNTDKVFFDDVTDFSGSSFSPSSWAGQAILPDAVTSTGPALTESDTTLYAVYKAQNADHIWYESATTPTS